MKVPDGRPDRAIAFAVLTVATLLLAGCLGAQEAQPTDTGPTGPSLSEFAGCPWTYPDNSSVGCETDAGQPAWTETPNGWMCLGEESDDSGNRVRIWYRQGIVGVGYRVAETNRTDDPSAYGMAVMDHGDQPVKVVFQGTRSGFFPFQRQVLPTDGLSVEVDAAAFGAHGTLGKNASGGNGTGSNASGPNPTTRAMDVQTTAFGNDPWYVYTFKHQGDLVSFQAMEQVESGNGTEWKPTSKTFSGTDFRVSFHTHTLDADLAFESVAQAYADSGCRDVP